MGELRAHKLCDVIPEALIVTLGLGATLLEMISFSSTIVATRSFPFPISRTLCFAFAVYLFMLGMFNCNLEIRDLRRCIEGGVVIDSFSSCSMEA
jgi:hypothetical protein